MRIAYDAAPMFNPKTGVGHYAATLLENLLSLETALHFDLFALTRSNASAIPRSERVALNHLRIPGRLAVTAWELLRYPPGEKLVGGAEVVHGTNFWIPPIKRTVGIVTIHDLTFMLHPELCTPQVQRYRWIVPRVLERCAFVITPSETVRREVAEELGYPEDRILVTPEGVRSAFVGAEFDETLAARLHLRGDYILFAGTQEPRKNLDRLIKALGVVSHRELSLLIVGPPGWGSVDLPGVARRLGLQDRVLFSGYLSDGELASLMVGARAFVFPTIYEGFGLPPLEAMAAGVPVVASRAGALPEVLGEAAFWCDPEDIASIASAIDRAVSDEKTRRELIEKGRTQVRLYDWERTARLTLDAYRRVAAG